MNSYTQVHLRKSPISLGDHVLVKKDYDNNPSTRRQPFSPDYEEKIFVVIEALHSNHLRIQCGDDIRTVFRGRVKKIN